jgi:regulator of cell morphogenesis and NO signaling
METIKEHLATLAIHNPAASRVFHARGLDYCCGGQRPLDEACLERGLDPNAVLQEIRDAARGALEEEPWTHRPLDELTRFIVDRYHQSLRRELPQLIELAAKVEERHAAKPDCPTGLASHLRFVHEAVLDHLQKEEQVLFPMICSGNGPNAGGPVQIMELEHREHAQNLLRIREITQDFTIPAEACTSWQALYLRLRELEADLMEHIHLENNVLFPRALCE